MSTESTDWKALCAELVSELEAWQTADANFSSGGTVRGDADYELAPRARAALAQPEPEGVTDEEWEALKERAWDRYRTVGYQGELFIYDRDFDTALDDVRQKLARFARPTTEPEGLTDKELLGCMLKAAASVPGGQCTGILDWDKEAIAAARAVIAADRARFGRPTIKPVPVSERLPGPEDCGPEGSAEVGCCWQWEPDINGHEPLGCWRLLHRDWAADGDVTHWRPHHALPVPGAEVG
jgi:hypothetical protein